MGASSPTQFLGSVAARRTLGVPVPPRSRGFASHPREWFAFVTLSRSLLSIFCASEDYLSYIENYLILLHFVPRSLMASADSHQNTNTSDNNLSALALRAKSPFNLSPIGRSVLLACRPGPGADQRDLRERRGVSCVNSVIASIAKEATDSDVSCVNSVIASVAKDATDSIDAKGARSQG